jgi:hypothetical protein
MLITDSEVYADCTGMQGKSGKWRVCEEIEKRDRIQYDRAKVKNN